jgi:hypothetical protein
VGYVTSSPPSSVPRYGRLGLFRGCSIRLSLRLLNGRKLQANKGGSCHTERVDLGGSSYIWESSFRILVSTLIKWAVCDFPQTFHTNFRIKSSIMPRNRFLSIRFPSLFTAVWRYCFQLFTASWINYWQTRTECCVFLFHFSLCSAWTDIHFPAYAISDLRNFKLSSFSLTQFKKNEKYVE